MRLKILSSLIGLLVVVVLLPISAVWSADGKQPVELSADTLDFDREAGVYRASGDVHLGYTDLELRAAEMVWDAESLKAQATGDIHLTDGATELTAERIELRLTDRTATISNGQLKLLNSGLRVTGEEIEKTADASYRVQNGSFTACSGETPAWKFSLSDLKLTLGGYAVGQHAIFYLHNVPVLYLPYLIYPVKSERESGLLLPRVGFSDKKGYQLSLAWYQVIDRHLDATFYLDYLSRMGYGKGVEYRYLLGRENQGEANLYHVNATNSAGDRYAGSWFHQGVLPGQVRLNADLHYVSERDYFSDFGEAAGEYNRTSLESTLYAGRTWERLNLSGGFNYLRDLEVESDTTLQRLPEIHLSTIRQRIAETPLWWRFDSEATYFWRRAGMKGARLNVRPALAAIFKPGGSVTFETELAWLERAYQTSELGPGSEHQGIFEGRMAVSTRLLRDYSYAGAAQGRLRHEIEPEFSYHFIPNDDQSRLPIFDGEDRIEQRSHFRLMLTNRVAGRFKRENTTHWRELLYFRLAQEFNLQESRRDLQGVNDKQRPWLPLELEAQLRPSEYSLIDLDCAYDHYARTGGFHERFEDFNLRAEVHDAAENRLSAEYRYTRNELEYVGGEVSLNWLQPLQLTYRHRYAVEGHRTLEQFVAAEYRGECWSVQLSLRNRLDDRDVYLTFELSGLDALNAFGGR